MLTTGVDIIEIERVADALRRWGPRFLDRVYTPAEAAYCRGRVRELAVRFAAKEAISKALGTGVWSKACICWREMEILPDSDGRPVVHMHGRAAARAQQLGIREIAISLSHSDEYAVAFVVAQ